MGQNSSGKPIPWCPKSGRNPHGTPLAKAKDFVVSLSPAAMDAVNCFLCEFSPTGGGLGASRLVIPIPASGTTYSGHFASHHSPTHPPVWFPCYRALGSPRSEITPALQTSTTRSLFAKCHAGEATGIRIHLGRKHRRSSGFLPQNIRTYGTLGRTRSCLRMRSYAAGSRCEKCCEKFSSF